MDAETRITIAATTTVTLSELELKVWAHLSGYDPTLIVRDVTRTIPTPELWAVRDSLRSKLESAQKQIERARKALYEHQHPRTTEKTDG